MTTTPKLNGARSGMSYAAAERFLANLPKPIDTKFDVGMTIAPRVLRLDYLAARAIRYELSAPPGEQSTRREELELATAKSCGEWFQRTRPEVVEWVREGSES